MKKILTMFSDKANIYGASLREGKWNTYTMTIQEFLERLKSRESCIHRRNLLFYN